MPQQNRNVILYCLLSFLAVQPLFAQTKSNLSIAFVTTNPSPLSQGFAGFATDLVDYGLESHNTNFQHLVVPLSPGWLRYPTGIQSDGFAWTNGEILTNWISDLTASNATSAAESCQTAYLPLLGKGGLPFTNFSSLAQNVGGSKIIVCLNGFTDTPRSASNFVMYALTNHIPVAAWELCNEPYNFSGAGNFFLNGKDYATRMYPYYQAIKGANSNAVVSVFFGDPDTGSGGVLWDTSVANFTPNYWDAVSYHHYPRAGSYTNFSDLMALDNGELLTNSTAYVTNVLIAHAGTNVRFLLTESDPVQGGGVGGGGPMPPSSSLYGGIYSAELVMRLSSCPQMLFAGTYQLFNQNGIYATNQDRNAVINAATNNYVTNTDSFNFGFYYSAQVIGESVAYWAINRSTAVYVTTVGANGPAAPLLNGGNMPAIYAQAYQGDNGKRYVLITNKGSNAQPAAIFQDGAALTNQFLETFVTGSDPSATNSSPTLSPIVARSQVTNNPVTIPEYSVVRLEWQDFTVPPPVLSAASGSEDSHVLQWAGLTNVVYNVEFATNLLGTWATLDKIADTQTNFSFTDYNSNNPLFYRLTVP
ncbi:MAG TPA: hypothetical protein VMR33_14295 [Candidatus Baltobacteraceae bacterium]|jgi:hypothetical protein|nr:hypothetical protein [Candidatus Baltobacteraceae bacterium]